MSTGVDYYRGAGDRHSTDTCDIGVCLRSLLPDPDRVEVASNPLIADINIPTTGRDKATGR